MTIPDFKPKTLEGAQVGEYFSGSADVPKDIKFNDDFSWDTVSLATCERCGNDIPVPSSEKIKVVCNKCRWVLDFKKYLEAYESGQKYEG